MNLYQDHQICTVIKEYKFQLPIINPKTGKKSTKYVFAGKVDGIYKNCLVEYKTASKIDDNYFNCIYNKFNSLPIKKYFIMIKNILTISTILDPEKKP